MVGLKDNQKVLLVDCKTKTKNQQPVEVDIEESKPKHGRTETRKMEKYEVGDFYDNEWNNLIAVLIVITRTEKAYYVSNSKKYTAKQFNKTIRQPWYIENKDH